MKKCVILGSTGSLGRQALSVIKEYHDQLEIFAIVAKSSEKELDEQAQKLKLTKERAILTSKLGNQKMEELCELPEVDIVFNLLSGQSGLRATKTALENGKTVILGNKEILVGAGYEIMAIKTGKIIPIDSEHNALHEIMRKFPKKMASDVIIPCSGGALRHLSKKDLEIATAKEALAHPRWNMGNKVTIESALLLNKGFEVVEAHYLFGLPFEKIHVRLHPECQIHGIVRFTDGSVFGYFSPPDMKEHLENGLREALGLVPNCIGKIQETTFNYLNEEPDYDKFPGIQIVLNAFKKDPQKMLPFLEKEAELIESFLNHELTIESVYQRLK